MTHGPALRAQVVVLVEVSMGRGAGIPAAPGSPSRGWKLESHGRDSTKPGSLVCICLCVLCSRAFPAHSLQKQTFLPKGRFGETEWRGRANGRVLGALGRGTQRVTRGSPITFPTRRREGCAWL